MNRCQYMLLLATLPVCSTALAQSGTATWEVSSDGGVNWTSECFLLGSALLLVRLRLGWTGIDNAIAFGGSQFDAVILGATDADQVTNINRPSPFNFAAQTIVATRYSQGIKIDVSGDAALPGAGTGWVNPGQSSPDGPPPNTSNPAIVFTYWFYFDATGSRTISSVFNPAAGRALSVYTSNSGAQTRLSANQVTINNAIIYIPSPSVAAVFPLAGVAGCRRRR